MTESLLSGSSITLFGRVVDDIIVAGERKAPPEAPQGIVSDLQEALENRVKNVTSKGAVSLTASPDSARFARIYGFSYGGVYHEILRPMLFLVHGAGVDVRKVRQPGPDTEDNPFYEDLRCWAYDHSEQTIRLDIDSGRFEQVLLELMGDDALVQPLHHRASGARVSGARVSGARVSGARVSGARVSGARVSGARVDGD